MKKITLIILIAFLTFLLLGCDVDSPETQSDIKILEVETNAREVIFKAINYGEATTGLMKMVVDGNEASKEKFYIGRNEEKIVLHEINWIAYIPEEIKMEMYTLRNGYFELTDEYYFD